MDQPFLTQIKVLHVGVGWGMASHGGCAKEKGTQPVFMNSMSTL